MAVSWPSSSQGDCYGEPLKAVWNLQCWAAQSQQTPPRVLRALPACWRSWLGQEQHEAQKRVEVSAETQT